MPGALADFLNHQVTLGMDAKHQEGRRETSRHRFLRTYGTTTSRLLLPNTVLSWLSHCHFVWLVFCLFVCLFFVLLECAAEPNLNPSKWYTILYLINPKSGSLSSWLSHQHGYDHRWENVEKWTGFLSHIDQTPAFSSAHRLSCTTSVLISALTILSELRPYFTLIAPGEFRVGKNGLVLNNLKIRPWAGPSSLTHTQIICNSKQQSVTFHTKIYLACLTIEMQ